VEFAGGLAFEKGLAIMVVDHNDLFDLFRGQFVNEERCLGGDDELIPIGRLVKEAGEELDRIAEPSVM
jgi:hypothetical protein